MGEHNDHNNSNTTQQDCQRDCQQQQQQHHAPGLLSTGLSTTTHQEGEVNLGLEGEERQPQEHGHREPCGLDHDRPLEAHTQKRKTRKDRGQPHPPLPAPPPPPSPYPPPGSPQPAVYTLRSVTLVVPVNRPFPPLIVPGYRRKIHNPQG